MASAGRHLALAPRRYSTEGSAMRRRAAPKSGTERALQIRDLPLPQLGPAVRAVCGVVQAGARPVGHTDLAATHPVGFECTLLAHRYEKPTDGLGLGVTAASKLGQEGEEAEVAAAARSVARGHMDELRALRRFRRSARQKRAGSCMSNVHYRARGTVLPMPTVGCWSYSCPKPFVSAPGPYA